MKKLSKKVLSKSFWRWFYGNLTCFSHEHMQTFGYMWSMLPIVQELYDSKDEQAEKLKTYYPFFNTEPQIGSIVVGITAGLEEARANGAEEIDDLKKIFELTQYKFIFHQESDTLPLLDKVFENTLTQSQRNKIPKLEIGENILCIASDRNLEFKVHLTKEEDRIFEGGV